MFNYTNSNGDVNGVKLVSHILLAFFALIIIFGTFGTVGAGERGVKTRFNRVVGTVDTGLYLKLPLIESISVMNVQTQKEQTDSQAASKDLQIVNAKLAVNYNLQPEKVTDLYIKVGTEYKSKVIDPAIQEVVKAVTAQYTAEELITKRPEVTDKILAGLSEKLLPNDIVVTSVSITNFDFSESFNKAIELKVTAEQNALTAKNLLEQKKYEAEQTIVTAKADAESVRIKTQAINSQGGADYVKLQAIQKWNGVLPAQMIPNSAVPFIDLK